MRGKILATKLNVRERPSSDATSVGLLQENTIVNIFGENDGWYEIDYKKRHAYAASRYIQPIKSQSLLGKVKSGRLNVRSSPGMNGAVIGQLSLNAMVSITAEHNNWLEIAFNQTTGFIYGEYVELIDSDVISQGKITVSKLNVRNSPDLNSDIVGTLNYGAAVSIRGAVGKWYEIVFNDSTAYVASKYVTKDEEDSNVIPLVSREEDDASGEDFSLENIPLEPSNKLDADRRGKEKNAALTWNRYGQLIEQLAGHKQLETACAIAVLCVESSGDGFRKENQNRQVIRFENHKFWKYWGKHNTDIFNQHFKLNLSHKPWLGHKWRPSSSSDWMTFHGNQLREWQVLDLARSLDDTAALLSISMGAPQIMGFHYKKIGYNTVQEMFDRFNTDIRYHILGFFEFLTPAMLAALRSHDFEKFAGYYNGSGQKVKYGKWIKEYYDTFKKISG